MLPMTATVHKVYASTTTTFLFDYFDALEETLTHLNILNLKRYLGYNVTYSCAEILVYDEGIESSGTLKHDHLGEINPIFEDIYDPRFRIWYINKHKEVAECVKKLIVCDMDSIKPEFLISSFRLSLGLP